MTEVLLGGARIFASHYQIVICDDPSRELNDQENWDEQSQIQGFAGTATFRMVGTEADLNDHWIELVLTDIAPDITQWEQVTCVYFQTVSGAVNLMSVIDITPVISVDINPGDYAAYFAGQNLGVDLSSLGEDIELTDDEIAKRKDLEWYRIFLVPGIPEQVGRLSQRLSK